MLYKKRDTIKLDRCQLKVEKYFLFTTLGCVWLILLNHFNIVTNS